MIVWKGLLGGFQAEMGTDVMSRLIYGALLLLTSLLALCNGPACADESDAFFEAKIRPVLAGTCFRCHGDAKTAGALRVDSRELLLSGGESGPAIVPGKPEESLLVRAIQREADVSAMPPEKDKALRADQVADIRTWIKAGAKWPAKSGKFESTKHWANQPVQNSVPPDVQNKPWINTTIDPFILKKQEQHGILPGPAADKRTLIRRATFDLTGLPPTPEEVEAFLSDESPKAFESVIDRLLQSPAYGERWGRHWLDVVRYADTAGETADYPVPLAWRYRNYVIDAFNSDKPYDEFLREQIAGDILANQGPPEKYAERVTATGYLAISRRFGFDSENYHHLTIQDTIDTVGQSVLGLSLGCARCHDHKFDAVTMQDYYALYGIFDSSRYAFPGSEQKSKVRAMVPLIPPQESQSQWRQYERRVATLVDALTKQKQPLPLATLRSINDTDGDFELQAPANGGSLGVLVPPWLSEGPISVTNGAQSPFKNLYATGRAGVNIPAGSGNYRISQALYPHRSRETHDRLYLNVDFRVGPSGEPTARAHRLSVGQIGAAPAVEVLVASESLTLRAGETNIPLGSLKPGTWQNLQLALDLKERTVSGQWGAPGAVTTFEAKPLSANWSGVIDYLALDALNGPDGAAMPTMEYDNLGLQEDPIPPVSMEYPILAANADTQDLARLTDELQTLVGIDGDLELQTKHMAPSSPWNPGPNSVVKLDETSQSPFHNIYPPGELGIHMPNRGEYDGFGLTLSNIKMDEKGRLFVSFDFRCRTADAGGNGTWRYYIGHGPGNSAAVELFFNGREFFRRSGDAKEAVTPLVLGQWSQVQLTLDLKSKTYKGVIASPSSKVPFSGQLASGWDGLIDYSFIDSYGHIGGVRPSLDTDNFRVSDQPLPALDAPPIQGGAASKEAQPFKDCRPTQAADASQRECGHCQAGTQ